MLHGLPTGVRLCAHVLLLTASDSLGRPARASSNPVNHLRSMASMTTTTRGVVPLTLAMIECLNWLVRGSIPTIIMFLQAE